jgi:hypothetical protein
MRFLLACVVSVVAYVFLDHLYEFLVEWLYTHVPPYIVLPCVCLFALTSKFLSDACIQITATTVRYGLSRLYLFPLPPPLYSSSQYIKAAIEKSKKAEDATEFTHKLAVFLGMVIHSAIEESGERLLFPTLVGWVVAARWVPFICAVIFQCGHINPSSRYFRQEWWWTPVQFLPFASASFFYHHLAKRFGVGYAIVCHVVRNLFALYWNWNYYFAQ